MPKSKRNKYIFVILFLLLPLSFVVDVFLGSVRIPFAGVINVLFNPQTANPVWITIINEFRIPKAITAILAGGALSVCGLLMQTYFRNPLAEPYVLGISSGASLGVALVILTSEKIGLNLLFAGTYNKIGITAAAMIGGVITLSLVALIARKVSSNVTLLILGLMIGYIIGSVESILKYYSTAENLQGYVIWGMGNFGNVIWRDLAILVPVVIAGLIASFLLSKQLNLLLLGENYALSMGANIKFVRLMIIIIGGILGGAITAFCGPIAFVGIAVPHITKNLFNVYDHKILIPSVALVGAILALICDIISQMPGGEQTLPVNAVTSLIGAPIVIWIILSQRKIKHTPVDE
jgi:iron complex transport system permease protein